MKSRKVEPVFSLVNPNSRKDTVEALKRLAAENVLQSMEQDRSKGEKPAL